VWSPCAWRGRPAPAVGPSLDLESSAEFHDAVDHLGVGVDEVHPCLLAGFELPGRIGERGLLFAVVTSVGLEVVVPGPFHRIDRPHAGLDLLTSSTPAEDASAGRFGATQRFTVG
jgi:hypothetical protein